MKKYRGGEAIPKGVYLNLSTWELAQLYGDKPVLPGSSQVTYVKITAPLAVAAGPFAGLVFIIFLPFIGIIGILSFIAYKTGWAALDLGHRLLRPVMLNWQPGRAYLTREGRTQGRKKSAEEPGEELSNMSITEIGQEIARRRERGEK